MIIFFHIIQQNRRGKKIVHGDIEETLNLTGMQIHGKNTVGSGGGNEISQ